MDRLKQKFAEKAAAVASEFKQYVKQNGNRQVDTVTLRQLAGGMRGVKSLVTETSLLDPMEGIRFRGYSIPELKEKLPKAPGGKEPLPEGLFWLMLTDELPTEEDVRWLTAEWTRRSHVPDHVFATLDSLPTDAHPMTQFSIGIMALQTDSIFTKAYSEGISKKDYWDPTYEDTMNLVASLPRLAAYIYRRSYGDGKHIAPDPNLDWAANFAHMLGNEVAGSHEMMRMYLTIHADHEGGNASAHSTHLTGSTLSDAYASLASGMNALAGPLHGKATQEVIKWVLQMLEEMGTKNPTAEQIETFIRKTLSEGKVIPGYGHAVLRKPDPRFTAQMEFAKENFPDDPLVNVIWKIFDVTPKVLGEFEKIKNPWPNVDAHSGALLMHYEFTEYEFYTVMFGVSRATGVLASLCWDRALGMPIERPKSMTIEGIKELLGSEVVTS